MAPKNSSEYARIEAEIASLKEDLVAALHWPKAQKESIMRQMHAAEEILGKGLTPYNGNPKLK